MNPAREASEAQSPAVRETAMRWARVKELFHRALEIESEHRDEFLARACTDDAALHSEVRSLLSAYDDAGDFLEEPAFHPNSPGGVAPEGRMVGPYRLVRELGRGGMGVVYLAYRDDGEFQQQVAVKLVKRGMDTDSILRRFRSERQILAGLDHPNIARLLDGGTTADGLPYFVMEYIDGAPIDRYCASRELTERERLVLFRDVCAAVHFAHQRLVVHRDLKPANVLVTAEGVPKLLDFGIAKFLHDGEQGDTAVPTAIALRPMTPEYASPEQLSGALVTTLSDVYSLGVVLAKLLRGTRQSRSEAADIGASHAISLRGDLDNIVARAMHAEPERRYHSAEALSDDIRRYLGGLPVEARPDTFAYRASKFVRRNRIGVTTAALALTTLAGAAIVTARQAHIASVEGALAQRRFEDVRRLATSFLFELHDAIRDLPGSTHARELLANRALASLDALSRESGSDPALQRDIAAAYIKIGDVLGLPYSPNLGHTADARASYEKALAILAPLSARSGGDTALVRELSVAHQRLGRILTRAGDYDAAVANAQQAVALGERLAGAYVTDPANRQLLGEHYLMLGRAVYGKHTVDNARKALALFDRSLEIRESLLAATPSDVTLQTAVAQSLESAGYAHWHIGDETRDTASYAAALTNLRRAHVMREAVLQADSTNARARRAVPDGDREIGQLQLLLGDVAGAAASFRSALTAFERLARQDAANAELRTDIALAHQGLGQAFARSGDVDGGTAHVRAAIAVFARLYDSDHANEENRQYLVSAQRALAAITSVRRRRA